MKSYIHKNVSLSKIFMKLFIFITVFYTFYISAFNALGILGIPAVGTAIMIILGTIFTNKIRLSRANIIAFLSVFLLFILNALLFGVVFTDYLNTFFFCFIPMILAGGIIDFEKYHGYMYRVSCFYILVLLIYVIWHYVGTLHLSTTDNVDIMGFAYYAIPSMMIIIYNYFREKKTLNLLFLILGAVYLLICGTRGPILCVLVFGMFCLAMDLKNGDARKKLWILALCIFAFLFLMNLRSIAASLYPIFQKYGFSTRFFAWIINEDSLVGLSGRDSVYGTVLRHISEHPILGGGLMEEWIALRGYAHNIVLELFNAFGIPVGIIIIATLLFLVVFAFVKTKSVTYKYYIAAFACVPFVKLMVSSSFLQESSLYILIGMCFSALRYKNSGRIVNQKT